MQRLATGLRPGPQGEFTALPRLPVVGFNGGRFAARKDRKGEGTKGRIPPIPGSATVNGRSHYARIRKFKISAVVVAYIVTKEWKITAKNC